MRRRRAPGQHVEKGEGPAEIESEKVVNELDAPATGVRAEILVAEEEQATVGALLAVIARPQDDREDIEKVKRAFSQAPIPPATAESEVAVDRSASAPGPTPKKKISISRAARKIAVENGIDWHSLSGTGPGGRIVADDVRKAMESGVDRAAPLSRVRQAIAARTLQSIKAPQAALCREIDVTAAIENRGEISLTALIASATARVLELLPVLNARWEGERLCVCDRVNIGIVLAMPGGIIVPVIHDAAHKPPVDMDLASARQRERELLPENR